jgi:carbon monoxide dehydrogenase subunit G
MAQVKFEVLQNFSAPAEQVWAELIDWQGHADWVPMTRVSVEPGDPTAIGARFTAWTGIGPLALKDQMQVSILNWDAATHSGTCEVTKIGPVLRGRAGFTVTPTATGSELQWLEDVKVPVAPQFLAPVFARLGIIGFRQALRKLAKTMDARPPAAS